MSVFAIHKFLFRIRNDDVFRQRVQANPQAVLDETRLTGAERSALERGDVRTLYTMGVHAFLLQELAIYHVFGLDRTTYRARIRGEQAVY
jgi:hypothetical protein